MLRISRKKVKTVYTLMHVSFFVGLAVIAAGGIFDFLWISVIPAAVCIGISVICDKQLRTMFSCPKCTNCLISATVDGRKSFIVDPLNQYDKHCSVCGEEINVELSK